MKQITMNHMRDVKEVTDVKNYGIITLIIILGITVLALLSAAATPERSYVFYESNNVTDDIRKENVEIQKENARLIENNQALWIDVKRLEVANLKLKEQQVALEKANVMLVEQNKKTLKQLEIVTYKYDNALVQSSSISELISSSYKDSKNAIKTAFK